MFIVADAYGHGPQAHSVPPTQETKKTGDNVQGRLMFVLCMTVAVTLTLPSTPLEIASGFIFGAFNGALPPLVHEERACCAHCIRWPRGPLIAPTPARHCQH